MHRAADYRRAGAELNSPIITLNGHKLTLGQSMTLISALETFSMVLTEDGMPEDYTIEREYLRRIQEIRRLINYADQL
jgi:hypothetical protein